jgi:hypothetical protein
VFLKEDESMMAGAVHMSIQRVVGIDLRVAAPILSALTGDPSRHALASVPPRRKMTEPKLLANSRSGGCDVEVDVEADGGGDDDDGDGLPDDCDYLGNCSANASGNDPSGGGGGPLRVCSACYNSGARILTVLIFLEVAEKMKAKLAIGAIAALVLSGAAYWFAEWNLSRSFRRVDWNGLQESVQAPLGEALTARPTAQTGPGAIQFYREHPEAMQRDASYVITWRSATVLGNSVRGHQQQLSGWTSSADLARTPPDGRTDAWGHTFCVRSSAKRLAVVSPGPEAPASFDCSTLTITESDIATMVPGRLNIQPSGVLVLVLAAKRPNGD